MNLTIVATSRDPASRSQALARHALAAAAARGLAATLVDLRTPESAEQLGPALTGASHIVFAAPVYNFDVSASTKQVIEDHGGAFEGKTVGFLCAAGGPRGYMSVLGLANSLMLDFRCWIVPRFVYATGGDFEGDLPRPEIARRIDELIETLVKGNRIDP